MLLHFNPDVKHHKLYVLDISRKLTRKNKLFSQVKEWLCLTCQMQRALAASASVQPPPMKAQASPSKGSTPSVAAKPKDAQTKEESQRSATEKSGSVQKKEDKIGLPPEKDTTKVASDPNKPMPPQPPTVNTDKQKVQPKDKDATFPTAIKEAADKKEDKTAKNEATGKQLHPTERPGAGAPPPSSSPKSPRAASKTTEAVTGKMFGFGSSLFSSASTLITSAVQESRSPPASRKMSAPAQVSDKKAGSAASPKASPGVPPRVEAEPVAGEKLAVERRPDPTPQVKPSPSDRDRAADRANANPVKSEEPHAAPKVGKSTCQLCKAELNTGSNDPPNYSNCTECKSDVCNKCGFSPMPSAKEVTQFNL